MKCEKELLGICFVTPSNSAPIFGFSEFISALALLLVVYTITDVRFRFRVAIAPQPVFSITFWLMGIIGASVLLTDVWVTEHWLAPTWMSQSVWRGILGAYFLLLPMTWLYYGYIRPPVFGTANYRKFAKELYGRILQGSESELPIIANELARSAPALVTFCKPIKRKWEEDEQGGAEKPHESDASTYAHDLILLLANRKLCRHIVASSPITAMAFFDQMTLQKKYAIPIGPFASNISAEAILNKDSILYYESDGYDSGLMGYRKDFSQAIYGNFGLVESLATDGRSPLDIPYEIVRSWRADHWKVFARAVTITLRDYLASERWHLHSYALYRSIKEFESSCIDLYKLNNIESDYWSSDIAKRLDAAVDFVKVAVDLIGDECKPIPSIA